MWRKGVEDGILHPLGRRLDIRKGVMGGDLAYGK